MPMNAKSERASRPDGAPPSQVPAARAEEQHALEAHLRRSSLRDRLLQLLEWVYPYAASRTRNRRRK